MTAPVIALIKPPTAAQLRGIKHALHLAQADADQMMPGERREQRDIYAGLEWLNQLVQALGSRP